MLGSLTYRGMFSPWGPACKSRRTQQKSLSAPDEEGPRCFDEERASLPMVKEGASVTLTR
jgi:hypothetical protein